MIPLLVSLFIIVLLLGLLWWGMSLIPVFDPAKTVIFIVVCLLALLVMITHGPLRVLL